MPANRRRIPPAPDDFAAGRMTIPHVEPQEPEWLWKNWLARGMLHVLEGDEGSGKSAIVNWLVSVASRDDVSWPGDAGPSPGIITHLYSQESPYRYTTGRDLQANGANLSNILLGRADSFYAAVGNLDWIGHHAELPTPDLVVINTWSHYSARDEVEEIKNQQITLALSEFAEVCADHNIAGLVVMHTRKNSKSGSVRERIRGGIAHRAVPLIVMSVEVDHSDPDKPHVLARTKENLRISLEGGFRVTMKDDSSLTYQAVEGYGPDLILDAMKSSEAAERGTHEGGPHRVQHRRPRGRMVERPS
ncbi:MAG: AAA family ATPase [Chloroflexi bacterium]|nr:AAA family ATPase [Chloroflexota bacterium]